MEWKKTVTGYLERASSGVENWRQTGVKKKLQRTEENWKKGKRKWAKGRSERKGNEKRKPEEKIEKMTRADRERAARQFADNL